MANNKTYIAFDGDHDMNYYRLLEAWKENKKIDFDFENAHDLMQCRDSSKEETIKRSLRERMKRSNKFILLIGEHTKHLYKFVKWEVEVAMELELPIICVNINKSKKEDDLAPKSWFKDYLRLYVPFELEPIKEAIRRNEGDELIKFRNRHKNGGAVIFSDNFYKRIEE